MKKLTVKQNYGAADPRDSSLRLVYQRGDVIEVDDELAAWLMNDAPIAFEVVKKRGRPPKKTAAVKAPPKAAALKEPGKDRAE